MMGNLSIITKAYLWWNARCDALTNQFHYASHTLENGDVDRYAISNFITLELRRYEKMRAYYQSFKPAFFYTPTAWYFLWIYKFRGLDYAIADINSAVEMIQGDIVSEYTDYLGKSKLINKDISRCMAENASHYAAMHEKRLKKVAQRFVKRERRRYRAVINVLKRKINLIHKSQGALKRRQQKFFLRIATYYRYAGNYHNRLPVQYMGDDRFAAIANVSTTTPYEDALLDAEEKLLVYAEELGKLSA